MRCCLFALMLSLIALFVHHSEAASLNSQLEQPNSLLDDALYRNRRSLASGRWGLRPGKRSIVEPNVETADIDIYATEVAGKLNDRLRRNLATGRWGLRPGKRSVPSTQRSYDLYWLLDN
ncbi:hypothetical protein M3Y97_00863400 [Aphelenchoides bicaudatus]|nr:hypothetical protein M3Y97_00863400 [Aphelenchoides bicaudatus]